MSQFERYLGKKLDGRYELREIIGIGGMAVVYSAYDLVGQCMVAVKLLKDEYLSNNEFRRRFKTESKAISMLSHPNIVKIYDVCLGDRLQYIVMELVDGITLKEYIEMQKALPWKDSVHFLTQILQALQHAHEKGIIHRDIKPQNILLTSTGTIKVTDFGIARMMQGKPDINTGRAIGSVHYICPEQARGDEVDARGDLYSTGVVLYEMLTGKLPFEADSALKVALMQMQNAPVPPRQINPDIPEGLEEITLKAMQKDPANRYPSAAAMLAAVEEFKSNPSISFSYKYFASDTRENVEQAISTSKAHRFIDRLAGSGKKAEQKSGKAGTGRAAKKPISDKTPTDAAAPAGPIRYKSRWLGLLAVITVSVVVATLLFAGASVLLRTTLLNPSGEEVDLPNLVGLNYYDVMTNETYAGFVITFDDESTYNDTYAENVIYEQSPTPPKKVKTGSSITVKVSQGPSLVPIPDLTGREKSAAVAAVENLGLFARIVERFSADSPAGYVLSTDPPAGTELTLGGTVTLYVSVSTDSKAVAVPYTIVGMSKSEAELALVEAGLTPGAAVYADSAAYPDSVISATPEPGSLVSAGTTVSLVISNGAYYTDNTETMDVLVYDMPQRSFRYLIEVYDSESASPINTTVMEAGSSSFRFTVAIKTGSEIFRIKVNGQNLRDIIVHYDTGEYYQRGIDYAVDLSPGYIADDYVAPANSYATQMPSQVTEPDTVVSETSSSTSWDPSIFDPWWTPSAASSR